jgi:GNAT superfamily N-acetyltransferase
MDAKIRQAKPQDWKIIQVLNKELFDDNAVYDRYLNLDYPLSNIGIAHAKKAAIGKGTCCFIAFVGNKPIGYMYGGSKKIPYRILKTAEVYELTVSPGYRSQGVGKQLVEQFKQWCRKRTFEMIMVSSYFANDRAVAFYKKCGLYPTDITLEIRL